MMSDIKAMGFKDVHTLIDVMKNKASGELQDDKTYLMEHTIQVSHRALTSRLHRSWGPSWSVACPQGQRPE